MPALRPLFSFLADSISTKGRSRGHSNNNGLGQSGYFKHSAGANGGRSTGTDSEAMDMKDYPENGGLEAGHHTNIRVGDSESEEGILPYQGNRIVKTSEFIVR